MEVSSFLQFHQARVIPILQAILHRIADGFQKQKSHIFGFGSGYNEDHCQLGSLYSKLDMAPINNLDSKRDFDTINYELKIHGEK